MINERLTSRPPQEPKTLSGFVSGVGKVFWPLSGAIGGAVIGHRYKKGVGTAVGAVVGGVVGALVDFGAHFADREQT